ncbi:MAG: metallophosphatase family protein, partial [Coriobacteriia bacterium]|nr:metallophosphatase family protein [Coriobacteriia bacterium]
VLSDTHGPLREAAQELHELIAASGCDYIAHAGDSQSEPDLAALETIAPLLAVRGNCDWKPSLSYLPAVLKYRLGNTLLVMAHKPADLTKALQLTRTEAAGAAFVLGVHGHTHVPELIEQGDGTIILCPGSPTEPRGGSEPCIAVVTIAPECADAAPRVSFKSLQDI